MPRQPRNDHGKQIYHVINRGNARFKIFETNSDYELFESVLIKAVEKFSIKLFAYNNMPNHFHLVVYSEQPKELSRFMQWLSVTFTQRWHAIHDTAGTGHLFQGRYKSFPINNDAHLLQVILYVERNAFRAGLVKKSEKWRWCSAWIKIHGNDIQKRMLAPWPIERPQNYLDILNEEDDSVALKEIRFSILKNIPIGSMENIKPRGRSKKGT